MAYYRPICIIAAVVNVSLYLYMFFNELPKSGGGGSRGRDILLSINSTNPLGISTPHSIAQSKIKLSIWRDFCPSPKIRVRLVGPEIYVFPIFNLDSISSSLNIHTLEVDISKLSLSLLVGVYKVEATLVQCYDKRNVERTFANAATFSCTVESEWINDIAIGSFGIDGNNWAWVHSPTCNSQLSLGGMQRSPQCAQPGSRPNQVDYVFTEINRETKMPEYNNLVTFKEGTTTLSKPDSLLPASDNHQRQSIFNYFSQLSNYELVCWLGDDDARQYWRAFMDLYPLMGSSGQRAFKFKYLRLMDISDPSALLTEMTYDKCKILFISYGIDRFDAGITPKAYSEEVSILLGHTQQSHPDETYPVWFLSPRSSTLDPHKAASCIDDAGFQGRTPGRIQTFKEEIRQLFNDPKLGARMSDSNIHFMDNSDVTEAFWHVPPSEEDSLSPKHTIDTQVSSAVAMRCMEKIAQQVKEWRSRNQIGTQNGLMKNGTLIPNSVLFKQPYTWGK